MSFSPEITVIAIGRRAALGRHSLRLLDEVLAIALRRAPP